MGGKASVLASEAERKNFSKMIRPWGKEWHLYHTYPTWEQLEEFVREQVQQFVQTLLEEVMEVLGLAHHFLPLPT
jgi:hypothetical protein